MSLQFPVLPVAVLNEITGAGAYWDIQCKGIMLDGMEWEADTFLAVITKMKDQGHIIPMDVAWTLWMTRAMLAVVEIKETCQSLAEQETECKKF